jgi:hypothetical protein
MTDKEIMQMALNALEQQNVDKQSAIIKILRDRLTQFERQWVGLTDKDIASIGSEWVGYKSYDDVFDWFAREIEVKLKEKNA